MSDWCLYCEAVDVDGTYFPMTPDVVIVNVPDGIFLSRTNLFRFLETKVGRKGVEILTKRLISPKYWGTKKLYSRWGKILTRFGLFQKYYTDRYTMILLANEIPDDLKKGFGAFGKGYLVRFYDWGGSKDEDRMKLEFSIRHPELAIDPR